MKPLLWLIPLLLLSVMLNVWGAERSWEVIWVSSETVINHWPICPVLGNELCPGSYIPLFKEHRIACHTDEDGCQDFVEALNAARERRLVKSATGNKTIFEFKGSSITK